ncbi:ABC transporter permease [Paenibacillus sp. Soil787]|uniref:ABC transporter permease n=1 Tax=Paenibacillus sp. Soil787 TaxID=1736411 RepID=UPI0007C73CC0|nr:ABC transporter permease subunit [Paenibacillus sp. Soil787]
MRQAIAETGKRTQNLPKSAFAKIISKIRKQKFLFLLMLPGILYFLVFKYVPLYGILLAFKEFNPIEGIMGSPWVGLKYFQRIFDTDGVRQVVFNTLRISFLKIVFGFPAPIVFALMLNEIVGNKLKRLVQTVTYLPHFLSWIVISGLVFQLLSPSYGLYGYVCELFGWKTEVLLTQESPFISILIISEIWKEVGYGSIIYLAAIAGIGSEMYEAAKIDGAGRFKQIQYVTLPSLLPIISIMFILRLGHVLDAGFEEILSLYNPLVYGVADIIDTYVYRIGLESFQYSFGTAVGLCKGVVALVLIVCTNWIVRRFSDHSIW